MSYQSVLTSHWPYKILGLLVAATTVWVVTAAWIAQIDSSDAYAALSNAEYFLGLTDRYAGQRGPLMALLLVPAEWVANLLMLHPLDIRPHHLSLAGIHSLYLVSIAWMLSREYRHSLSVWIGFLIVIPNFIFFSYAPFISHDIFPGALFLAMLLLAERFAVTPRLGVWLALVTLGLTVALIKHTYALCWVVVLAARILPTFSFRKQKTTPLSRVLLLFAGAATSGVAAWLIYAWALGGWAPHIEFLWRPYVQIRAIPAAFADDPSVEYPLWFYFRNYPVGFGLLNALLLGPAIYLGLCSASRLRQSLAIAVLLGLIILHLVPFYETRYLSFLMPPVAMLMVPLVRFLWLRRRRWWPALWLLLAIDLAHAGVEALRIFDPFYSENWFKTFLAPIETAKGPIIITRDFSFAPDQYSPLVADRYHRMFHLVPRRIEQLFDLTEDRIRYLTRPQFELPFPLADPADFGEEAVLFYANTILIRRTDITPARPKAYQGEFIQLSARVRHRQYQKRGSGFFLAGQPSAFLQFGFDRDKEVTQLTWIGPVLSASVAAKTGTLGHDGRTLEVWGFEVIMLCSTDARGIGFCLKGEESRALSHAQVAPRMRGRGDRI